MKATKNSLKIKDLVSIGVFFVIYTFIMVVGMIIGSNPLFFLIVPFVLAIVEGTVVMLFMAKVPKPWALFIFGMLGPLMAWGTGHTFILPLAAFIFAGLAELIFRKGGFKSFKYNALAYGVFSCWLSGGPSEILLVHDRLLNMRAKSGFSPELLDGLVSLVSWQTIGLVILSAFIGGLIGAFIGKAMLKKHFRKAGIV